MIYKITVPGVIDDVQEIRVLEWHGEPGQRFETDDMIVELETHKAVVEVRAAQAGYLRQILSEAGDWKRIGLPIGLFSDQPDEGLPENADVAPDMLVAFEVC